MNSDGIEGASSVGGSSPVARVQSSPPLNIGAGARLDQVFQELQQDFGEYATPDEVAAMLDAVRQLAQAGLPLKDVADAMYSNPGALYAMRDGNATQAAEAVAAWMVQNLNDLKDSGVPENRLQMLSQAGFAVGEIMAGLRVVPGLRESLAESDFSRPRDTAAELHQFLRNEGRATHRDDAVWQQQMDAMTLARTAAHVAWFETYLQKIKAAQRRFAAIGFRTLDEDAMTLPVQLPAPPVETPGGSSYGWLLGVMMAVVVILFFAAHC